MLNIIMNGFYKQSQVFGPLLAYHIACNFPKDRGYESYMDDLSSDPQPRDIGLLWRENMGKSGQPPKSTPRLRWFSSNHFFWWMCSNDPFPLEP